MCALPCSSCGALPLPRSCCTAESAYLGGLPCTGCTAQGRTAVRRAVTARPNKFIPRAAQRCERGARRGVTAHASFESYIIYIAYHQPRAAAAWDPLATL